MARARCNARLTAGWLSSSRDAAAVTLFSSAMAANVIRRFKSTCRSFSKRMAVMTIMHEPHVVVWSSVTV
jgi:uroporphyrinogen-III synthase